MPLGLCDSLLSFYQAKTEFAGNPDSYDPSQVKGLFFSLFLSPISSLCLCGSVVLFLFSFHPMHGGDHEADQDEQDQRRSGYHGRGKNEERDGWNGAPDFTKGASGKIAEGAG